MIRFAQKMHGYVSKYPLISRRLTISFRYTHTKKLSSKYRIQKYLFLRHSH